MKSRTYIPFILSSLLLLCWAAPAKACGFYETDADYRAMMFRALLPGMKCMRPFTYTTSSVYYRIDYEDLTTDPDENDRYRNCSEWLAVCDKSVSINDIYTIQYSTSGDFFLKAFKKNTWQTDFADNTFVKFLAKKENKGLLDYMLFAKEMEITEVGNNTHFEEWESENPYGTYRHAQKWEEYDEEKTNSSKSKLLKIAQKKLDSVPNGFLQQRYAFQVIRLQYQLGKLPNAIQTYNKYFGAINPDNLMSTWATLFAGMSYSSQENNHYRYLINVFANSDEKKMCCVRSFDGLYDTDSLTATEQSIGIVMDAVRNPGRALDQIRNAYTLDKNNKYIPFLVLREINKLEDWLITPLFYGKYSITNSDPFQCAYYNSWLEKYEKEHPEDEEDEKASKLQAENLTTDMQYMAQLKALLEKILSSASRETKDFYAISLAHISLLQQNANDARKYLGMVSDNANITIRLQKKLETAWLAVKTQDIHSAAFKKTFLENIAALEKISTPNYESRQMLYTLTLSLANEYLKKNDRVLGNLVRMKADMYKGNNEGEEFFIDDYRGGDTYWNIVYFDINATVQDMDNLMALLEKKDKTPFEKYICNQPLASINFYKDLKGTIAFRNNDLQTAYTVFASMPKDYWQGNNYEFASYLNEDPFVPKGLRGNKYRNYNYKFNKADFVKELIDLEKQATSATTNRADVYIKLGNAYFNTSYWGSAWMMTRYGSSHNDMYYSKTECLPTWARNYLTADLAKRYYEKALKEANNDEQRAYAVAMLHLVHKCRHYLNEGNSDKNLAIQYAKRFRQYNKTETFRQYECSGFEEFLSVK